MKKLFALGLSLITLAVAVNSTDAFTTYDRYSTYYPRYWNTYMKRISERFNRPDLYEQYQGYSRGGQQTSNTVRYSNPYSNRRRTVQNTANYTRNQPGERGNVVRIFARNVGQIKPITELATDPIEVFDLGFSYRVNTSGSAFTEAAQVETVTLEVIRNFGLADDLSHLRLVAGDQDFSFDADGRVTLRFKGLRLAKGETQNIPIYVKVDDPSTTPNIRGNFRLRAVSGTSSLESSGSAIVTQISGSPVSSQISFVPNPSTNFSTGTNSIVASSPQKIYGKQLSAGQSALVLAVNFRASFDDFLLDEITVKEVIDGQAIDGFVERIDAVDLRTNKVLDSGQFAGGQARFNFYPRVTIPRETEFPIGFRVHMSDRIRSSDTNTKFRLSIDPSDVEVQGIGSGKELADSNKNFSIDNETFTVVANGFSVFDTDTQTNLAITGAPSLVHTFALQNGGRNTNYLGRVSFSVSLNNLNYPGGISADDFQLVRVAGRRHYPVGGTFTVNGNTIMFDFSDQYPISRGEVAEFGLRIALENGGGSGNSDSVVVQLLGDTTFSVGTLSNIRANNYSFIWSDGSASPHTQSSADWLSGYLVPGLPGQATAHKR